MKNLTWTCHVCDKERPDEKIGVATGILKDFANARINIRFCNDNATCTEVAREHALRGEFIKPTEKSRVKCYACNKPIKLKDLGCMTRQNNKEYWFHNNIVCLIRGKMKGIL